MNAFRFVFMLLILTAACAAQAQRPSTPYTFEVPAGWKAMSLGGDGTIVTSGDAYVRIVKVPGGGKNEQLVKQVVDQIAQQWKQFKQDERGQAQLAGNAGIYVFFSGVNPKGVEATMRLVAAPVGADAYMLIMSAPKQEFLNIREAFKQIEHTFALSSGSPQPAPTEELPARPTANGIKAVDEAGGGHILFSPLTGVSSGQDAFRSGLGKIRGYFDASPNLLSMVASKDHNTTISVFNAALHGKQVAGFVTATYDPAGNSHFAVVYDAPDHLKTSLTPMMRQVHEMVQSAIEHSRPAGSGSGLDFAKFNAEADHITLTREQYPEGVGSIGIAPGYTPHLQGNGSCFANAADGSYMNLMGFVGMADPRGSLYKSQELVNRLSGGHRPPTPGQFFIEYDPNPVSAWKKYVSALSQQRGTPDSHPQIEHEEPIKGRPGDWTGRLVSGTMTIKGEKFAFTGSLMVSGPPPPVGNWSLSITILAAPINNAAKDFPALIAMKKSVRLDLKTLVDNTNRLMAQMMDESNRWIAANKAAGDAARDRQFASSMANAAASRDAMDRSTAGFIHYINDTSVLQHNPTGARGTVGTDLAKALEQADPQHLSVVSPNDYIKGVDY